MNVSAYVKAVAFIIVVGVLAAAAAPQDRSTVTRVALFALVVTAAIGLVDFGQRRSPLLETSPFEGRPPRPPRPSVPADLERLAVEVRACAIASELAPTPVPPSLRRAMEGIAASRLARRGLSLDEPADAGACADACGTALTDALRGQPLATDVDRLVRALEAL
jgi:hypothetical protein